MPPRPLPERLITNRVARLPTDLRLPPLPKNPVLSPAKMLSPREALGERTDQPGLITIRLDFAAIGKPRMTQRDRWAKRPCVLRYRDWCDKVRAIAGDVPPAWRIASVNWTAWFEPPKSWSKIDRLLVAEISALHRVKPDKDNLEKAILDCLWKQDSGIAVGTGKKVYGERDRLEIEIALEART